MKIKLVFLCLLVLFLFNGCGYFSLLSNEEWKDKSSAYDNDVDIYVVGTYESTAVPCCWKNGERFDLEHPSGTATYAKSICIEGEDIYVGGYIQYSPLKACFWKNGKLTTVQSTNYSAASMIYSIKCINGVIYACGQDNGQASLWINDKVYILPGPTSSYQAWAITIDEATLDFYIAGACYISGILYPCYWKNGKDCKVVGASNGAAFSIDYKNGNLLIGGRYNGTSMGYWVNERYVQILASGGCFYGIKYYKDDIYTTGYAGSAIAYCYKNLTMLPLIQPATYNYCYAIDVYNNDVYVAGSYTTTDSYAFYQKNGAITYLEPSSVAYANGIIVLPKKK